MATLKAGTTAGGSNVLTDATHGNSGDPHTQYKLITDLVAEYYNSTQTDAQIAAVVPDLEAERIAAEAASAAAAVSETNAAASATAAASSATSASSSSTSASTSASAAATSEANAATSETNAVASATTASTAATNASTSETNAASSASAASTSASNASTSETNASASETAAQAAQSAAETAYDNFDDRYLGQKASDPTLDNDGNALLTGALYFNTTSDVMRVYNGSAWQDVAPVATSITLSQVTDVTATAAEVNKLDGVTATTAELNYVDGVTSAIQTQMDTKAPLASPALTGTPTAPTPAAADNTTKLATTAYVQTELASAGGGAWELIEEWTPTAVGSKDFSWTYGDYSILMMSIEAVEPQANSTIGIRCGTGGSFDTGSSNYECRLTHNIDSGVEKINDTGFVLAADQNGGESTIDGGTKFSGLYTITPGHSGYHRTGITGHCSFRKVASSDTLAAHLIGVNIGATGDIDNLRIYWSGTSFTASVGKVKLWGMI